MPVRIYEIAKKLGLENKEVLAKAKELGITAGKVPSSSLDKITAEFLEEQLAASIKKTAPPPPAPAPVPPAPIILVSQPVVEAPPTEPVPAEPTTTASLEPSSKPLTVSPSVTVASNTSASIAPEVPIEAEAVPEAPIIPAGPKVGDKVGFIQLPTRPAPRSR